MAESRSHFGPAWGSIVLSIKRNSFSADGLARSFPADRGVSSQQIDGFLDDVEAAGLELHGLMVWRDGAIVAEGFRWPYRADRPRILHSMTKSFTACAIGLLIEEKRLSLHDRVCDFFPEVALEPGHRARRMTVEHLLTMRTGHASEVSGALWRGIDSSWIVEFFRIPIAHDPGSVYVYSSAASYMLSAIVTRITGETMHDYLRPRLFQPLGIRDERWDIGPDGVNPGGNGITAPLAVALKLGILHAQGGVWAGRRILPAAWVEQATKPQGDARYGYHWVIGDEYFAALGVFVQAVFVYPKDNAVVALIGAMEESKVLLPHLKPHFPAAFRDSPTPGLDTPLADRLRRWGRPEPIQSPAAPLPALAGESRWAAEPNTAGIETIALAIAPGIVRITLAGDETHAIAVPIGDWNEEIATLPAADLHHGYTLADAPVVVGGRWLAPDQLELQWHFVESAFRDTVTIAFAGDRLTFDRAVNVNSGARAWATIISHRQGANER